MESMTDDKEKQQDRHWHAMDADEVVKAFEVDSGKGLSGDEAARRLEKYGRNEIPKGPKRTWWQRLLAQFHNVLIYVLIGAAVITALMGHWIDTWVILAVVIVNALIGFIQEGKAEKALESIQQMLSLEALVIRDGTKKTIDAEELVPGDVVLLKSGDKIPADLRLVKSKDLRVEESPLTGESTSVDKAVEPVEEDAIIGDQYSMAFSGTSVTYGKATGVVTGTGTGTEIGKINVMMSEVKEITTPLLQKIEKFGKYLSLVILGIVSLFFAFGYFFRGDEYSIAELFMAVIGLVVAAIPEGLPAIMTITLAIGVQRMAARNAIIRKLPSVETLGSVNVICSDKTGTLTRNEMTARSVITAEKEYRIEGTGYKPEGKFSLDDKEVDPKEEKVLWQLLQAGRVCNNAQIREGENGEWELIGTPTEGAIRTMANKAGLDDFKPERIDSIPFESDHKYMATLNQVDDKRYVFMTGAPERVLEMCTKQLTEDGPEDVDAGFWEEKMEEAAARGQRLLGMAFNESEKEELNKEDCEANKIFLGIAGIIDPPRDEAVEAIRECKEAGVEVKMITGDHVITARAIGKEIGIGDGEKAISGKELEKMSDEELQKAVEEYDVYARTSPEHKLRLVKALQANNKLCAMTGDGVNDAPALKKANIGIAMGIKGTEVSKDASEMVLADDNFASIANAIEEGRTVYDNIKKALLFMLPTNGAESLVLMAAILIGMVMPITPLQVLWVNMVTAVTLALALAFEPMEEQVMERPPRSPDEPILGKHFIWRIVFVSFLVGGITMATFTIMQSQGVDDAVARTIAVNTLVAGQLFYLFNCRKIKMPAIGKGFFGNKYAFIAAGALIALQMLFVYTPFMNTFFDTAPIEGHYWWYSLAGGVIVFITVELEKFLIQKRG